MMCVLATLELNVELDLVLANEEITSLLDLEIDVVFTRLGAQPNFFQLHLMLLCRNGRLPLLLVLELAIVHDSADGRAFVWSHFNQIEANVGGEPLSFRSGDDAKHLSLVIDDADRRKSDLLVDSMRGFDCWQLPERQNLCGLNQPSSYSNDPQTARVQCRMRRIVLARNLRSVKELVKQRINRACRRRN